MSTTQGSDKTWRMALALLCGGILCFGYFYPEISSTNAVFMIRYKLPFILVLYLFFYLAVVRKRGAKIVSFSFLTILMFSVLSSLIGFAQLEQQEERALKEIRDQANAVWESVDSQGFAKLTAKPIDITPKARGEYGEVEKFIKELMSQSISQRNEYLREMDALNIDGGILDARRLHADKKLIESKVMLQKAKEILNRYQIKSSKTLVKMKEGISLLTVDESFKAGMLSGYENSKNKIGEHFYLEGKAIEELENIINFLSARNEAWVVQGEQIAFFEDDDLNKFNSYLASLQDIQNQQLEIERQNVETFNHSIETLNRNSNGLKK